ncbi:MAG TPA: beta-ketoacyl-ACP synthase II [Acidimicrobiales bacterium]|nr:beta-ketoacyl-ACP synthase II [Acidimicrobiales bacterium]
MQIGIGRDGPLAGRRVAVTGLGALTCAGLGVDTLWEALVHPAANPGDHRVPADFDASMWFGPKEVRRVDRFAQFAVASSAMALDDAGPLEVDPARAGVFIATGVGGLESLTAQVQVFHTKGANRVSPFLVPMMMANAAAAQVSMRFGWFGPSENVVTACAAGTHAVANAARLVASGRCDVVMAGGAEAALDPVAIAAFTNMTALSTSGRSRPFDVRRDGFVMTEGAGALVLEDWDHALGRGARIYAEVAGGASTADAHHITAPEPNGAGAVACMELALLDAGLTPDQIAHINAHGTSTPINDLTEARAINKVFGEPGPPVTSNKGVTGHGLAAAGAIEAVASVLTIDRRLIPPTAGLEELDPEIHLDVVQGQARPFSPGPVLSNSFGFGGHNGCLVLVPPG